MGIQERLNRSRLYLYDGSRSVRIEITVVFCLLKLPLNVAENDSPNSVSLGPKFNPSMATVMIVLVAAFFFMGFCSVYIRQCVERRYRRGDFDPTIATINWSRRPTGGLDTAVIEKFPTFEYSMVKGHKIGKGSLECAVCLSEFEDHQTLRLIPNCSHVFHVDCIDTWLSSHSTCPVCRADLVPASSDSPFASVFRFLEPDNNSVEAEHLSSSNNNEVRVAIASDDEGQRNQPDNTSLLDQLRQQRPPRSRSTGWQLGRFFSRSHSTGHSLVQLGENYERFTLRLPNEVRNQLMNTHLNRTKSSVVFPRAKSTRQGYRSKSVGSGVRRNLFCYERFDQKGRPDRWGFSITPPFVSRANSVHDRKGVVENNQLHIIPQQNLMRTIKLPFDRLIVGSGNCNSSENNENREASSDGLRHDSEA